MATDDDPLFGLMLVDVFLSPRSHPRRGLRPGSRRDS